MGGEKDEQGSLDFISSMIKREILSSPKTSQNHERQSQQALLDSSGAGRPAVGSNIRKSPLRMSQDMVQFTNRNRILKPVNELSSSSYGRLQETGATKSNKAISSQPSNSNSAMNLVENSTTSRSKLTKSSERFEKYTNNEARMRMSNGGILPQSGVDGSN